MKAKEMVKAALPADEAIRHIAADFVATCTARKAVDVEKRVAPYKEALQKFQSYYLGVKMDLGDAVVAWQEHFPANAFGADKPGWDALVKAVEKDRAELHKAMKEAVKAPAPKPKEHKKKAHSQAKIQDALEKAGVTAELVVN